jgi:nucleotide-binding universal stress UspA family protein
MLTRVLAPLDGSPTSAEIFPPLRQWLGGTGAVVHLLLVRPPVRQTLRLEDRVIYLDELLAHERATWQDYLLRQGSQLAYDGMIVHREVRFGDPVVETLAVVQRQPVQLIALVDQLQAWPQRWLCPSLAERLLTRSPVPVLVMPPAARPTARLLPRYGKSPG